MARPPHLAVGAAAVAALVVPFRSLHAFGVLRDVTDLVTLTYVAQLSGVLVTVVGFATLGYAYGRRTATGPRGTLVVAAVAALVGVLAAQLVLVSSTNATWELSLPAVFGFVGARAVLDAATFGLVTLGGYALGAGEPA